MQAMVPDQTRDQSHEHLHHRGDHCLADSEAKLEIRDLRTPNSIRWTAAS
jgi:hypothetical protein